MVNQFIQFMINGCYFSQRSSFVIRPAKKFFFSWEEETGLNYTISNFMLYLEHEFVMR